MPSASAATTPHSCSPPRPETAALSVDHLGPRLSGRRHRDFLAPSDATPERTREAFDGPAHARLRSLKAGFDPRNMFRLSHTIPPGP
ncbi:BBE domain-containing protein [Streptomyces sp. NPDC006923]|uniref:BBE domain-containing protein n=1 Tax=Streptomyces sp. NPDC006923 TaxID=3155355 RepID=UPI0033F720A2